LKNMPELCLPPTFVPVSCLACSSTLKIKAKYSSETSVDYQRPTQHCMPDDRAMGLSFTIAVGPLQSFSGPSPTHDQILQSQIGDSPNLEGQVPIFITPRNRVVRLYPQVPSSSPPAIILFLRYVAIARAA
jgi:hypothetical protein